MVVRLARLPNAPFYALEGIISTPLLKTFHSQFAFLCLVMIAGKQNVAPAQPRLRLEGITMPGASTQGRGAGTQEGPPSEATFP